MSWSECLLKASFLFFSKCAVSLVAFLRRFSKSSGMDDASPAAFIVCVIVFPAIGLVSGTPCWSRSIVPILLALCPSLASLIIMASISSGVYLHHIGVRLPTGRV